MIVVVGAGVAGTGAALAAARAGARVTVVDGGSGASSLWTGGVDDAGEIGPATADIARDLGVVLGKTVLVTEDGLTRVAAGHEASLLDLGALRGGKARVGIVKCARPSWSADLLARAPHGGFFVLDAVVLRRIDERWLPDADFAARHDDDERFAWLAERLRDAIERCGTAPAAVLLPPSLGLKRSRAAELSVAVGVPCGEAVGLPGGPCGLRFEAARDLAFAKEGVAVVRGRARSVSRDGAGPWTVDVEGNAIRATAVIVATGGLIGGGIEYQPSEAMEASALPPAARPPFACTLAGPLPLGTHARPLEVPGSLFGVPPESIAWPLANDPLMDRVGVLCDGAGRVERGLYAAGEIVADRPHTWLDALDGGVRAGAAAARDVVSLATERPPVEPAEAPATRP